MANTKSAKKALRQSIKRKESNLLWKKRIKDVLKTIKKHLEESTLNTDIIKKEESLFYKVVDKAAKNNVFHKNKANRIKARVSKNISAHAKDTTETKPKSKTRAKPGAKSKSKS
jgi:small subunit ribosomal protein S20